MTYGLLVRPFLKFLDSENAHTLSLKIGSKVASTFPGQKVLSSLYNTPSLPIDAFGMRFRHPLGLAAGMDKKCEALPLWPSIGFSWIEGGGITYHPQDGNLNLECLDRFRSGTGQQDGFQQPGAVETRRRLLATKENGSWPRTH